MTSSEKRLSRITRGACGNCGARPPKDGCQTCQPCMDAIVDLHKKRTLEKRIAGICIYAGCKERALGDKAHCEIHAASFRRYSKAYYARNRDAENAR